MKAFQQHTKDPLSDTLIPTITADDHILNIGVTDTVADCPSHSNNIPFLYRNDKAVTSRNQSGDQTRTFAVARIPPPLRSIQIFDLTNLFIRGDLQDYGINLVTVIHCYHLFSAGIPDRSEDEQTENSSCHG
ncbi:MAG: hypothetical protein PHI99_00245 [Syntrophales bacterium]|nr:hypothetical protein [Syntrophales bacterium]